MPCREEDNQVWKHDYNEENRLWKIEKINGTCASQGSATLRWTNTYDGDGVRVQQDFWNGTTTTTTLYFMGGMYEIQDSGGGGEKTLVYHNIGGVMVAMDDGTDLVYFASDNLSSASLVMNDSGTLLSEQRYMPFGEVRTIAGTTNISETDFGFTGQRNNSYIKLIDYKARSYSPYLNRFIQPDSIIPNLYIPQSLNRFSYASNNPIRYNDPSGHRPCGEYGCNGEGSGGWYAGYDYTPLHQKAAWKPPPLGVGRKSRQPKAETC